jgi:tight adherence protein B
MPFNLDLKAAVFLILIFAMTFALVQALSGLLQTGVARRKVNRRLVLADRLGSLSELVLELRKQRGLNEEGDRRLWAWFGDLVLRSGMAYKPRQWMAIAGVCGTVVGLIIAVFFHFVLLGLIAAIVVSLGGPIAFLSFKAKRRAKALGTQLPNALDVIVRSLEAGHPVPSAVSLVGREMPDPIGSEFGMASDEIAFGSSMEQAVNRMAERCRHPDVDLFAATVRLQERSGGNLTGLLKTNARTIRERQRLRLKIQAASSEGRASAIILTSAPFAVFGILMFASPHFYGDVIREKPIQMGLMMLGGWMFLGNMVMRRMIDMRI